MSSPSMPTPMPTPSRFDCFLVEKDSAGKVSAGPAQRGVEDLPDGDVLIEVEYSSLNYKDALSASGNPGVTRKFPHVPGIDAAGRVVDSRSPGLQPGQGVLVTGYELGMNHWGGFARYVRTPAEWVVPLPAGLTAREAMILGTAGFTAAMALEALQHNDVLPERGEVVVTGASGGVGSLAVALLAQAGYQVAAVTGKPQAAEYLSGTLGAARVLGRDEVDDRGGKPLLGARWAGAIDTVGGNMLSTVIRQTQRGGCIAACGLVGGAELSLTVLPFLLRGVVLAGIDSAEFPYPRRVAIWNKLAGDWKPARLDAVAQEVDLAGLPGRIEQILAGQIQGRVLVRP